MRRKGQSRPVVALSALCGLGACTHVPPAPVDVPARAAARTHATLDEAAIRGRARAIAPAAPETPGLDRLALFAALLELDPRVAEARRAVESARKDARAARKAASPTLGLTGEYANDPSTSSPWLLGGALDLPLDIAGRRDARIGKAELGIVVARYDLAETIWSERMILQRALIDMFAGLRQVDLATAILALRDRQLTVLAARAQQGEIATLDLYPYRAQRAQAARTLDDARARVAQGRAAVAAVLGLPAMALAQQGLVWDDFASPAPAPASIDAATRAQAIAGRADILRSLAAYDRSEADLRGELARQYPAVSLGPGYTWERGLVKLPFGANLSLPSFDLNRSAIAAAEAKRAQAGAAIESVLAAAQGAIESAVAERRAAGAALARIRREELPPNDAAAARADSQLRVSRIGRADWAAAKIAALEAHLAEVDALARVRMADAALEEAMRRPLEGPETLVDPKLLKGTL
jgi:cobalt-zinc-cadmium efflux system outer membrane protein